MNHDPAIRVLREYASKSRQAAALSSAAGFAGNAAHCTEAANSFEASAEKLQTWSDEEERSGSRDPMDTFPTAASVKQYYRTSRT